MHFGMLIKVPPEIDNTPLETRSRRSNLLKNDASVDGNDASVDNNALRLFSDYCQRVRFGPDDQFCCNMDDRVFESVVPTSVPATEAITLLRLSRWPDCCQLLSVFVKESD